MLGRVVRRSERVLVLKRSKSAILVTTARSFIDYISLDFIIISHILIMEYVLPTYSSTLNGTDNIALVLNYTSSIGLQNNVSSTMHCFIIGGIEYVLSNNYSTPSFTEMDNIIINVNHSSLEVTFDYEHFVNIRARPSRRRA